MDTMPIESLMRRSRHRSLASAGHALWERFVDLMDADLDERALVERFTPEQLSSYQASVSSEAAKATASAAAAAAAAKTVTTSKAPAAAGAATQGTTLASSRTTVANTYLTSTTAVASSSVVISSSSAVQSSSSAAPSSASTSKSTSTVPTSTAKSSSAVLSTPSVLTVTSTPSSSAAAVSTAAANSGSTTKGLSTGSVVGIVLGALVGVVVIGSIIGFFYRKWANRAPWRQIDEDITPFAENKPRYDDDYYGGSSAPVIGSRRALGMATTGFDGSRPGTEYMADNRAGVGAGSHQNGYDAEFGRETYGFDPQGRPYNPDAGRVPMQHVYEDHPSRQLLGPQLSPVALGRPGPPQSPADFAQHEDYADYAASPVDSRGELMPAAMPAAMPYQPDRKIAPNSPPRYSPPRDQRPLPTPPQTQRDLPPPQPMPTLQPLQPLSPLMPSFAIRRQSQPLAMYADDHASQKQLYGEVSRAAGIPEPITPVTPGLDASTSTNAQTSSSFSAAEPTRLPPPPITLSVPGPYVHGQPLSPLTEVPTPASSTVPHEVNPFERLGVPHQRTLVAPHSASTTGATGIPSPAYPPPSPGGMSVPGSVTDSPRRWSGRSASGLGRQVSVYGEDDVYGGI